MAESLLVRKAGGGLKIEETLQNFTVVAGQTITAGTFVDYIKGLGFGSELVFNSGSTNLVFITALGTDKIVVSYRDDGNSSYGTAIVGTVSGTSISWGSEFVFNTANSADSSITALGTDKIIITYRNSGNSNYGTAIVGTVSGTSISWGSPFVFNTAYTSYTSITAVGTDKIVVSYRNDGNSGQGTARVGTVSGTSISWGSPVTVSNASTADIYSTAVGTDKIVVAYRNEGNLNYGTARVGTVSGTSISWGSALAFNTATTIDISITTLGTDKIVFAYRNIGNSGHGTAKVGTVSGTSISLGSPFVFNTATSEYNSIAALGTDKIIVAYWDSGNSNYGTAILGTVSGTSISWGSPFVFNNAITFDISITALGTDKIVVAYRDFGNSSYGTAIVGSELLLITNTTSEKVFGLAKTGGTGGQTIEVYINE
jgi:hypothetical protein